MYKYKIHGHDGTYYYNETGITLASSYHEAMKNLSDYYDEDSIIDVELHFIIDDLVIALPEDIPDKIIDSII